MQRNARPRVAQKTTQSHGIVTHTAISHSIRRAAATRTPADQLRVETVPYGRTPRRLGSRRPAALAERGRLSGGRVPRRGAGWLGLGGIRPIGDSAMECARVLRVRARSRRGAQRARSCSASGRRRKRPLAHDDGNARARIEAELSSEFGLCGGGDEHALSTPHTRAGSRARRPVSRGQRASQVKSSQVWST
jgi:hypothetical protein